MVPLLLLCLLGCGRVILLIPSEHLPHLLEAGKSFPVHLPWGHLLLFSYDKKIVYAQTKNNKDIYYNCLFILELVVLLLHSLLNQVRLPGLKIGLIL
jgi:hypothetical protein